MRIAFMGSPDFSVPALADLIGAGHEIACVYSQPPKPAGRGLELKKTPVHAFAECHGVPVRTPKSLKKAPEQEAFAALALDVAVVVAYGLILPQAILDAPTHGCLNLHASLLPRWRGAAPIQRAIMAGDRVTGVQVMQMEAGLDTGPILLSETCAIEADDTAQTLHDRLSAIGAPLIVRALAALERGSLIATPQSETGLVYAHKIDPSEARIDWSQGARAVDCHIRGLSPFPGAWFEWATDKGPVRVKALACHPGLGAGAPGEALDDNLLIACGDGAVRLTRVQREGRQPMAAGDFLRGKPIAAGTMLR
jgi:methionyl-tRNA formyltransferase